MVKSLITDFSRVLLLPKDKKYEGGLNSLHKELSKQQDYQLLDHFELNFELLDYYKSLRDDVELILFTSETIQDSGELQPFIQPVFKEIYSASKMGVKKKDVNAYQQLASLIGFAPLESIYIDDNETNIAAANKAGFQTILYKDNESVRNEIQKKLLF